MNLLVMVEVALGALLAAGLVAHARAHRQRGAWVAVPVTTLKPSPPARAASAMRMLGLLAAVGGVLLLLSGSPPRAVTVVDSGGPAPSMLPAAGSLSVQLLDAAPGDCTVDDDGPADYATISAAVADADCTNIEVAAGTYDEHVNITRALTISGAGADVTTIDGGGSGGPVVTNHSDGVVISGFTITGGKGGDAGGVNSLAGVTVEDSIVTGNSGFYTGGIRQSGTSSSTLKIAGTRIEDNTAVGTDATGCIAFISGGVWSFGGRLEMTGSSITGNVGGHIATAIYMEQASSTPSLIEDTVIDHNKNGDSTCSYVDSAVIFGNGGSNDLTIRDSQISGRWWDDVNPSNTIDILGIYFEAATANVTVEDSTIKQVGTVADVASNSFTITGSVVDDAERGIFAHNVLIEDTKFIQTTQQQHPFTGLVGQGTFVMRGSTLDLPYVLPDDNLGTLAAGVTILSGTATLENNTFLYGDSVESPAHVNTSAVAVNGGTAGLVHNTIISNDNDGDSSDLGIGVVTQGDGEATLSANIIIGVDAACSGDGIIDAGYNLDNDGTCATASTSFTADPMLGPLQDNGGDTPTMAPAAGSPAVDAVPVDTSGACVTGLTTDQRGIARPQPEGLPCDIGAVELEQTVPPPTAVVTTTVDQAFYSQACTLPDAIAANLTNVLTGRCEPAPDNTVRFDDALGEATIGLSSNLPTITGSVTVDGGGDITIDGSGVGDDGADYIFNLNAGDVVVRGLTLTGAAGTPGTGIQVDPAATGAISLTVEDSWIHDSRFAGIDSAADGQVTIAVRDSTLSANGSYGIRVAQVGAAAASNLTVENSTIVHDGAGIEVRAQSDATAVVTVRDATITDAASDGISLDESSGGNADLTLTNSIIMATGSEDCASVIGVQWRGSDNLSNDINCPGTSQATNAQIALGALQVNGGGTPTRMPAAGSVAIDAADDTVADCPAADQRGISRPQPAGGACDIGSVEVEGAPLPMPDLTITKSGPAAAAPGGSFDYTLTVTNAGQAAAQDLTVIDALPAGVSFDAVDSSPACSATGQDVSCTTGDGIPSTPGSNTVSFTVAVVVGDTVSGGTVLQNTATVSTTGTESDTTNNTSETVQTVVITGDTSATITGQIFLQGRTANLAGTIVTFDNGSDPPITASTNESGSFTITVDGASGPYEVSAIHDGYLRAGAAAYTPPVGESPLPAITLRGGDLNGDGMIDILDISLVAGNYGLTSGWSLPGAVTPQIGPPQHPTPDFNADGVVNILDLGVTAANYGTSSIIPWP